MALSSQQVQDYLDRISLPEATRTFLREGPDGPRALEAITTLQYYHLLTVPFENLDLAYSSDHTLTADTDVVYNHVVKQKRGGVCDQIHQLFAKLLQHFKFSVYCTGSRINASAGILADKNADKSKPVFGPWCASFPVFT